MLPIVNQGRFGRLSVTGDRMGVCPGELRSLKPAKYGEEICSNTGKMKTYSIPGS